MKKELKIFDFEDKLTEKGKQYARFKTNEGWLSSFNKDAITELKRNCGNWVRVDVVKSGDFQNIKSFLNTMDGDEGDEEDDNNDNSEENKKERKDKDAPKKSGIDVGSKKEMYISYAKDVLSAIMTRISQAKFDDMEHSEILKLADLSADCILRINRKFA